MNCVNINTKRIQTYTDCIDYYTITYLNAPRHFFVMSSNWYSAGGCQFSIVGRSFSGIFLIASLKALNIRPQVDGYWILQHLRS